MSRIVADRYELARPIGRGGMGEVWSGYDRRLDRPVAVKMLRAETLPAGTDLATLSQRFARESRLTARVEHRGVPAVHDAGTDDGDLYLVMQLIEGRDLADVVAEEAPLPPAWVAALGAQVAAVLAAAHDVSLVHRDLKPRNLMLSRDGAVTVLDFGVAALLEPSVTRLTTTGETLGSPAYMAPEQALEGRASPRSDLYALGCVLYELLAGSPVFGTGQPLAVMHRHLSDPPAPLVGVPDGLAAVILQLLAKEPAGRPADARAVYDRLVPFVSDDVPTGSWDPTTAFRHPMAPLTARRVAEPTSSPDPPEALPVLQAVIDQANELIDAGRYTQAVDLLDEASAREGEGRSSFRLQLLLATACFFGGDAERALAGYRKIHEHLSSDSAQDAMALSARTQIAACLLQLGRTDEAVAELRAVLPEEQARLGRSHRDVLEIREQVAIALASGGKLDAALAELDALATEITQVNREDDPLARRVVALARRMRTRAGCGSAPPGSAGPA